MTRTSLKTSVCNLCITLFFILILGSSYLTVSCSIFLMAHAVPGTLTFGKSSFSFNPKDSVEVSTYVRYGVYNTVDALYWIVLLLAGCIICWEVVVYRCDCSVLTIVSSPKKGCWSVLLQSKYACSYYLLVAYHTLLILR